MRAQKRKKKKEKNPAASSQFPVQWATTMPPITFMSSYQTKDQMLLKSALQRFYQIKPAVVSLLHVLINRKGQHQFFSVSRHWLKSTTYSLEFAFGK